MLIATLIGAGMWAVIVVLPPAQLDFGVDRSAASLPYTVMMCSLAFSTIALGRMTDRFGIVLPLIISAVTLGVGFVLAGYAPNLAVFTAAHVLIGIGAGTGFAPMMADISHWFVKRRGLAVVIVASGNYFAGTIWPLVMSLTIPLIGWRATYAGLGIIVAAAVLPLALAMRRRPSAAVYEQAEAATEAARARRRHIAAAIVGPVARRRLLLLRGDVDATGPSRRLLRRSWLWRGARRRDAVADDGSGHRLAHRLRLRRRRRSAASATLLIGSFMQGVALLLYLYFDGLESLFVVSGIFGLFQGGIVPMYAVICRELLPPRRAGAAIGLAVSATIFGMAFGGYFSGVDLRPHQLLPHGVSERRLLERVQFRHRLLALLAPPAAPAGRRAARRLTPSARGLVHSGPFLT